MSYDQAFPTQLQINCNGDVVQFAHPGMSLRDWFAGQALTRTAAFGAETAAQSAYRIADAMLAERAKAKP